MNSGYVIRDGNTVYMHASSSSYQALPFTVYVISNSVILCTSCACTLYACTVILFNKIRLIPGYQRRNKHKVRVLIINVSLTSSTNFSYIISTSIIKTLPQEDFLNPILHKLTVSTVLCHFYFRYFLFNFLIILLPTSEHQKYRGM